MPDGIPPLTESEESVLSLATEDAYALWEVAHEVGGDVALAVEAVKHLLELNLVALGSEDWGEGPPAFIREGQYVEVPFTGDVDELLADARSWRTDDERKYVVWATPEGNDHYFGTSNKSRVEQG